jgi:glycosyltransferase involved in cell wall biosynthesis
MRGRGRKLVYTVHNVVMHSLPTRIRDLILERTRSAYRQCDLLLVHDEALRAQLRAFLESELPEISVTPHGVLVQAGLRLSPINSERLEARRLLFFGQARPNKGLEIALDALSRLDGYELTIAGEGRGSYWETEIGPRIERLLSQGKRISVDDRFIEDEELPDLFNRHSCVLLPYTPAFHAQSGILFLALGARLPVVATDVGALGKTVLRMGIGEVSPPNNPESFASAIEALHHRDPEELDARFTAAQEGWSWSRCAKLTAEAYRLLHTRT